ncbi:hypothetical protein NE626_15250, partial [Intestinimonas massiliensis]|uniref:hypothetical protein n=1 Tax=Intestinimonas massiliensis (ex Afouda et al. 2020) TaxID=1673721 RepID=UPI00210EBB84
LLSHIKKQTVLGTKKPSTAYFLLADPAGQRSQSIIMLDRLLHDEHPAESRCPFSGGDQAACQ